MSDLVTIETNSEGFVTRVVFHRYVTSQDGGRQQVVEVVMTIQDAIDLWERGILIVGNLRPDHKPVLNEAGQQKGWAKTPIRMKVWANNAAENTAVWGNFTFNINPSQCEYEITDEGLVLRDGVITTLDGATRMRSVLLAYRREPRGMDTSLMISVRFWFLRSSREGDDVAPGELTTEAVFDEYQNHGKAVDQTVVRWHRQANDLEEMIKKFVVRCPHLAGPGATWDGDPQNIEIESDRVPARSPKLWSYNSIVEAFLKSWTPWGPGTILAPSDENIEWLLGFYNTLVRDHQELGLVDEMERQEYRTELITSNNLAPHGLFSLAAKMRREEMSLDVLSRLNVGKLLTLDSPATGGPEAGQRVRLFSLHNPDLLDRGIVRAHCDQRDGKISMRILTGRNARDALKKTIREWVGLGPATVIDEAA